jgi:hypothetical protein
MNRARTATVAGRRAGRGLRAAWVLMVGLGATGVSTAADPPSDGAPTTVDEAATAPSRITAVWQERRLSFTYNSATSIYSCHALEARVASVLRAIGARDDIEVRAMGCDLAAMPTPRMGTPVRSRTGVTTMPADERYRTPGLAANPRQTATVFVTAMLPGEVNDAVYAELEKDKARRELVARATGNPAARFKDPILFAAERQRVTLSKDTIGLEAEECELIEQMASSLLPQVDVRVVSRSGTLCSHGSSLPPKIVVDALMPFYGDPSSILPSPPADTESSQEPGPAGDGAPPSDR